MTGLFDELEGAELAPDFASLEDQAKAAEFWETDRWAADAILRSEILTRDVWDPCCGRGVVSEAAIWAGYNVVSQDLFCWGYDRMTEVDVNRDFLEDSLNPPRGFEPGNFTIFMNPPFSKAVEFVRHALRLGARKVVCFQRFAWYESDERCRFWNDMRPQRIYVCADRATCWLGTIPLEDRKNGTSQTHAWFVWEDGQPPGPLTGHVRKRR